MNAVKKAPWFAYFPKDYRWSAAVSITYSCSYWGASTMGEIHSACKNLHNKLGDDLSLIHI